MIDILNIIPYSVNGGGDGLLECGPSEGGGIVEGKVKRNAYIDVLLYRLIQFLLECNPHFVRAFPSTRCRLPDSKKIKRVCIAIEV